MVPRNSWESIHRFQDWRESRGPVQCSLYTTTTTTTMAHPRPWTASPPQVAEEAPTRRPKPCGRGGGFAGDVVEQRACRKVTRQSRRYVRRNMPSPSRGLAQGFQRATETRRCTSAPGIFENKSKRGKLSANGRDRSVCRRKSRGHLLQGFCWRPSG